MASTLATEFAHLHIPLEDVLMATNKFSDKNIIGKGGFGNVYKGQLNRPSGKSIKIVARRLDRRYGQGDIEFWTEVSMLSSLKHENIVSMIGFCDEKGEKVIINCHYPKGSLFMHLRDANLTWNQRLKISQGVATAIAYLHDIAGESYHVIHRNINSFTILLDDKWEPKLSGFEFSIKHSKYRMNEVFVSEPIGTIGYIDPETEKTGGVTSKSDIYSLGVVLFEILCGRKAFISNDNDNMFLAPLARFHYENKTLRDIIHPDLRNQMQMDSTEFTFFSYLANSCIKDERTQRVTALEVSNSLSYAIEAPDVDEPLQKFLDQSSTNANKSASFKPKKVKKLEHLRIRLEDIRLATNDFSDEWPTLISACESYTSYGGDLECINREYLFGVNTKNKDHLPKRGYNAKIKHIKDIEYIFDTEIEILGSCMHRNIESFLGYCDEGPGMILVFERVPTFSLHAYLEDREFTWEKRLNVCLDIAHGLDYLHSEMEDQKMVIHRDITSENIMVVEDRVVEDDDFTIHEKTPLLDKWEAYITEFRHAIFLRSNQHDDALHLNDNRVITLYTDPEYAKTGNLKAKSDVFSFGVVLFEVLCGMRAEDIVSKEGRQDKRLEHVVGRWFRKGIIKNMVARTMKEENSENHFFLNKGPNEDSLDTFVAIAYQCLAETQNQRPTMKVVIKELEKSLSFQENHKDTFRMSFEDIKLATKNFSSVIGGGGFGSVYIGEAAEKHGYGHYSIVAKRLDKSHGQGNPQFYNELHILCKYKHENVIGLVGYCNEKEERLIVYERASKGSLDSYLNCATLTWRNRLKICIDVATGLDFLHGGIRGQGVVIHRDIKAANILLFDDWKAKVGDFGLSLISTIDTETHFTIHHVCGTPEYVDPLYLKSGLLSLESDIYSFGVVLFEVLCGRAVYTISKHESPSLLSFVKHSFEEGKHDAMVFEVMKKEIMPKSLTTFQNIVCRCLDDDREKRPTSKEVLAQLKKAIEFQDKDELYEPILAKGYKKK